MNIILDLDGVLVDNLEFEGKVLDYILRAISEKYRVNLKKAEEMFWEIGEKYKGRKEWHDWRIYCKKLGLGNIWKEAHLKSLKYLKLVRSANRFLKNLKKDEHTLILASDAIRPVLEIKLNYFQLEEFFDFIFSQDETKCIKEDVKFFKSILKEVKAPPEEFIVIDNRIDRGISAGKRLGMKTIYIERKEHSHDLIPVKTYINPDFKAKKLSEAYRIIKRISKKFKR